MLSATRVLASRQKIMSKFCLDVFSSRQMQFRAQTAVEVAKFLPVTSALVSGKGIAMVPQVKVMQVRAMSGAPPNSNSIFTVNATNFMEAVLKSPEPVILDCYADWCQPCKELTPRLEKVVRETKGVRLAKMDVDANQEISGQLQVEVLPTLFIIHQGQMVDKVTGSLQPEALQAFVAKAAGLGKERDANELLITAGEFMSSGHVAEAERLYSRVLEAAESSHGALAMAGLTLCAMAKQDLEAAKALVAALRQRFPMNLEDPLVKQACSAVAIASQAHEVKDTEVDELKAKVDQDPNDHESRRKLATALFGRQQYDAAMEHALQIVKRDRNWNDGAGKKLLFEYFDTLGAGHERVIAYRKRLAALLF